MEINEKDFKEMKDAIDNLTKAFENFKEDLELGRITVGVMISKDHKTKQPWKAEDIIQELVDRPYIDTEKIVKGAKRSNTILDFFIKIGTLIALLASAWALFNK